MKLLKNIPNTALIGNGYWANILKKYIPSYFHTKYIANSTFNRDIIWYDNSITSVFIATPIETHYSIVKEALLHNKHVFVEKPLTTNSKQAKELQRLAASRGLSIVTDYTYTFSPNLQQEMKNNIEYIEIVLYRNNPSKYIGIDIHWVMSCHALAIVNMFMGINNAKLYHSEPFVGLVIGENFKIFTSLISIEKVTQITAADSTYVRTIPIESDNLDRAVSYFYDCINSKNTSNIETAIHITDTIERGLCNC